MADLFELAGKISVDATNAKKEIDETKKKAEELTETLVGLFVKLVQKSAEDLNAIDEFSETFGMTTDEVQELNYVLGKCGSSLNGFTSPMTTLANAMKSAQNGSKGAVEMFEGLGVAVTDSEGNMRSASDVLWETLAALEEVEDQMSRTALANKLFGSSGANLLKALAKEETTIADLRKESHDLGLIMSGDMVQAGGDFTESWETLEMQMNAAGTAIGGSVLPALNILLDFILEHSDEILDGIKLVADWIVDNAEIIATAIGTISTAMVIGAIAAHPYATAIFAVVAGLAALSGGHDFDNEFFGKYSEEELDTLQRYIDAWNKMQELEAKAQYSTDWRVLNDYSEAMAEYDAASKEADKIEGLKASYQSWLVTQGHTADMPYLDVPVQVSDNAESDLQAGLDDLSLQAVVHMAGDYSAIENAANLVGLSVSGSRPNTIDGIHANGIDYIPRDGYHALLHEGEAVLNRTEASAWRGGGSGSAASIASAVRDAVAGIQFNIVMDNGAVVGQLAHGMDRELGNIAGRKGRRN